MNTTPKPNLYLSKSLFMTGLRTRSLGFTVPPGLRDEMSPEQEAMFDFGAEVGLYAQGLFPGGILVPYGDLSHSQQLAMTQDAISSGASTIYEAAFSYNDVFVKADILHLGRDGWELYEVKSSANLKELYLDDIAIQYFVISGTGLHLQKASLVHLNTDYVREGPIDVEQLFTIVDLTDKIRGMQSDVATKLTAMKAMLQNDMPVIDIVRIAMIPILVRFVDIAGHISLRTQYLLSGGQVDRTHLISIGKGQ